MYSYLSFQVLSVIALVLLISYFHKYVFQKRLPNIIACLTLLILILFLARGILTQGVHVRFNATSVFSQEEAYKQAQTEMIVDAEKNINIARRILHDCPVYTSFLLVSLGYLSHFSPDFWFFDLNQNHHHAPLVGLVYLWMIPFFCIGIYWSYQKQKALFWVMVCWLLLSPIPASVTADIPHAIRSLAMVVPIAVFTASGICAFLLWIQLMKLYWKLFIATVIAVVVCFFVFQFFHQYSIHLPAERSDRWIYGRKQMTEYLQTHEKDYDRIIVSTRLEWPNIFFLYYSQFDPKQYLGLGGTKSGGWGEEGNRIGKYEFHRFTVDNDARIGERTLFVGEPVEFTPSTTPEFIVRYKDNTPAIYFVANH